MKLKNIVSVVMILIGLSLFSPQSSQAVTIDLNTFTADPATAVTITADGSSATMVEDPTLVSIWLYNDSISPQMQLQKLLFVRLKGVRCELALDANFYVFFSSCLL